LTFVVGIALDGLNHHCRRCLGHSPASWASYVLEGPSVGWSCEGCSLIECDDDEPEEGCPTQNGKDPYGPQAPVRCRPSFPGKGDGDSGDDPDTDHRTGVRNNQTGEQARKALAIPWKEVSFDETNEQAPDQEGERAPNTPSQSLPLGVIQK
jgi:hypothetical protein